MEGVSTTAPIRRRQRAILWSSFPTPQRAKLPPVGCCSPQMRRMRVVFPAPLRPTKP